MSNIKPKTEFRQFLVSQSQQLILPYDSPSTRSSILSSSSFIQGLNSKTTLPSYQTPQKAPQRSSFFDPRAQLKQLNISSDRQSLLLSSSMQLNDSEGSDPFNTSIRNSISITRKSFQDTSKSSRSQQQANPSLLIQPDFLSDREVVSPFVFPQPNKKPSVSIRLSSSKIDLPILQELNDNQGSQQNLPVQLSNSVEQLLPHQKRSVSLNPLSNDDILKDWLVGKTPQNTEPIAPKSIIERRKRRVSPAVIHSANLIEDQPKIERPSSPSFRASIGVLRSSNRRLSKREFKLDDSSTTQLNQSAVSQVTSTNILEQNRQTYQEDKGFEKKELSSPINTFLELKKMLIPTQSQRVSVTDLIKSMNSPLQMKKKMQDLDANDGSLKGKGQENGSGFSKEQSSNQNIDRQQQPIIGIANGQEENDGDISNRYVPSSMIAGAPNITQIASPTRISLKSSKGFMNLFRNSKEKVEATNKNTSFQDSNNGAHSLINSSSVGILQQNANNTPSKELLENSGFLQLRKQRIAMPQQQQNLAESSFSSQNSGTKQQGSKLKGVLKNKSIDNYKSRSDSMNFSEMETLDETQNKCSFSMGLGMMSQSTSNVSSFQKYIDQMDSSNASNTSMFQKEITKPSKKVMFQERVSIVDLATKYKSISTLTRLQNSKL